MTAREAGWLFRALGDGTRLRVLSLLLHREASFAELTRILRRPPSTLSRHLRYLHARGVVEWRPHGNTVIYRIAPAKGPIQKRMLSLIRTSLGLIDEVAADRAELRTRPAAARNSEGHAAHQRSAPPAPAEPR